MDFDSGVCAVHILLEVYQAFSCKICGHNKYVMDGKRAYFRATHNVIIGHMY